MGLLDSLMGRRKPARPNLDAIFGLPAAAITMETSMGLRATGVGAVAFRVAEGRAFAGVAAEITELLAVSGNPAVATTVDQYGYTWLVVTTDPPDSGALVTHLHAVNLTLQDAGFGPQLLCSTVNFQRPDGGTLALVYLFKQGRFYPFSPHPGGQQTRDTMLEMQLRDLISPELSIEPDLSRWFPIWGAPGLT